MTDVFVNSTLEAGGKATAPAVLTPARSFIQTFETAAADAVSDVRRIIRLPSNCIIKELSVLCDSVTGATDIDVGLYQPEDDGAVIDVDILADGLDLSGGTTGDGLAAVNIANRSQTLAELIETVTGTAYNKPEVDLALTYNSNVSTAATITLVGEVLTNN